MAELDIGKLERNLTKNDSYKEEERSADDTDSNLGEKVTALEAYEVISNLEDEEFSIIEEIAEVLERRQNKLQAVRDIPKKKLLRKSAKVDKVLCKLQSKSITKTNELFYAGVVVITNSLGVKINKAAEIK